MSINLATKYSDKIAENFTSAALIADKGADGYEFTGVKGLKVYTPLTVELGDYNRSGANRYGNPTEMQDNVQEMVMSQDKSFSLTIDRGNNEEQMMVKSAGKMLSLQIAERVVPAVDKYAIEQMIKQAGKVAPVSREPGADTVMADISAGVEYLDDHLVPHTDRYIVVTSKVYGAIRLSPEYIGAESLGTAAISKGIVGEIFGLKVIKVPSGYMPANFYFMIFHKDSVIIPNKIKDAKLHNDAPGISGALIEGRWLYDAFVLGARADGVYTTVLSAKKQAAPTILYGSGSLTITSVGANLIKYTVDGTDPRYSISALVYTSAVPGDQLPTEDYTVRAVAYRVGYGTSDVAMVSI